MAKIFTSFGYLKKPQRTTRFHEGTNGFRGGYFDFKINKNEKHSYISEPSILILLITMVIYIRPSIWFLVTTVMDLSEIVAIYQRNSHGCGKGWHQGYFQMDLRVTKQGPEWAQHPMKDEGWMVSGQKTVFCWVPVP
jgi:hypothetical protein